MISIASPRRGRLFCQSLLIWIDFLGWFLIFSSPQTVLFKEAVKRYGMLENIEVA